MMSMKPLLRTVGLSTLALLAALTLQAQPANDNFANRIALSGATVNTTGSNVGATMEADEPTRLPDRTRFGASVWWSWTAPVSGSVRITTVGSSFDTVLAVYTGTSVGTLALISGNDDTATNVQSHVSFTAVGGTTYRIAVDGYDGNSGIVVLNWQATFVAGPPPLLEIHPNGNQLVLAWPTNSLIYKLESTTNLAAGVVWSTNLPAPIIVNGKNTVTETVSGARKFYRLRLP